MSVPLGFENGLPPNLLKSPGVLPVFIGRLLGMALMLILGASAVICVCLPALLFTPQGPIPSRHTYLRIVGFGERAFGSLMVCVCWIFFPVELVVSGEYSEMRKDSRLVVMSNHPTYMDWWYLWMLAWSREAHGAPKFILLGALKQVPLFGLGMSFFEFLFLKRKWAEDRANVIHSITQTLLDGPTFPCWLHIFPEGTLIASDTFETALKYRERRPHIRHLPDPEYVLYPRPTGIRKCLEILGFGKGSDPRLLKEYKQNNHNRHEWEAGIMCDLFDITLAYIGGGIAEVTSPYLYDRYTPLAMFGLRLAPTQVHIHVHKHRIQDIPGLAVGAVGANLTQSENEKPDEISKESEQDIIAKEMIDDDAFADWLRNLYQDKEKRLKQFFANKDEPHILSPTDRASLKNIQVEPTPWDIITLIVTCWLSWGLLSLMWFVMITIPTRTLHLSLVH